MINQFNLPKTVREGYEEVKKNRFNQIKIIDFLRKHGNFFH